MIFYASIPFGTQIGIKAGQQLAKALKTFKITKKAGIYLGSGVGGLQGFKIEKWVRYAETYTDAGRSGQRGTARALITKDCIKKGTRVTDSIRPPGYNSALGHHRAHLVGAQLGGDGSRIDNFVTLYDKANYEMKMFEAEARRLAEQGKIVDYRATPVYNGSGLVGEKAIPTGITLEAFVDGKIAIPSRSIRNIP